MVHTRESIGARKLVDVWEWGRDRPPLDRSLALLSVALGREPAELAELTIGQRDAYLLKLYEQLFGSTLELEVVCPGCKESLEVTATVDQLLVAEVPAEPVPNRQYYPVRLGDRELDIRLPTSRDLAGVVDLEAEAARRRLVETCCRDPGPLSDAEVQEFAAAVASLDPQADVRFNLRCDACEKEWVADLDISTVLWVELERGVERMLQEVALLARTYGWSETQILAMSHSRRAHYVALASE